MAEQQNKVLLEKIKNNPELKDFLIKADWREQPVDILTFISDPKYLGNATGNGTKIYPVWKDTLQEIFSKDAIFEIVLTGAVGQGKSSCAEIGLAYLLYRTLCLKNPWEYYKLLVGKPLSIVFFSITLSLSSSNSFISFQNKIQSSPWFVNKGVIRGNVQPILCFEGIDYKLSSPRCSGSGIVGSDLVGGLMDEINSPKESVGVKQRAFAAYQSVVRRIESRFMEQGLLPGLKLFLCSSKDEELSFVDAHIAKREGSKSILVKDIPLWEAKPKSYSGVTFPIAVGDNFRPSRIIEPSEVKAYATDGYQIIKAPVEHRESFELDLIGNLKDIAGVVVTGIRRYKLFPSEKFIKDSFDSTKLDPIQVSTIKTGLNDETPWISYLDLDKIRSPLSDWHCIHLDISFSGDAMSLASASIKEWVSVDKQTEQGTFVKTAVPIIETDFILRIVAQEGDRIPLHQMRKFIIDLKRNGMRVSFTADLKLASEDTIQLLNKAKIPAGYFSVDKTPKPYMDFRNLAFEHRWVCHSHEWLFFELKNLEVNKETGKIDHPEKVQEVEILDDGNVKNYVGMGSKDVADSVCGSISQILMHAKAPIDVNYTTKMINSLNTEDKKINLPSDWFVSNKNRKKGKDGQPIKILADHKERHEKMLDVLKDLESAGRVDIASRVGEYLGK